jgi:ATPase family associated with various cellular activities (AAA)
MPEIDLERLRRLRDQAEELLASLIDDLEPFKSTDSALGFRRTPTSVPEGPNDVNVTTTCSCLMGLAHAGRLAKFYENEPPSVVTDVIQNVMSAPWQSSGLIENNTFTSTLVIRTVGALVRSGLLPPGKQQKLRKSWKHNARAPKNTRRTLSEIAKELALNINNLGIVPYPPAAAVVYWFVDGVHHAGINLGAGWGRLFSYATDEFRKQRSLVVARHTAMMDPVAMAMAACLCAKLHSILKSSRRRLPNVTADSLPTIIELESSIVDLFREQTPSGIWPKYFPLFHYKDAGSNFCYTFELLEAVLLEFGQKDNAIFLSEIVVEGLERAVAACITGRLETRGPKGGTGPGSIEYSGWNSGGNLEVLKRGQPESWATAVVHMFLHELIAALSRHIHERLIRDYDATTPGPESKGLHGLLDIKIRIGAQERSLRKALEEDLVHSFEAYKGDRAEDLLEKPVKKKPISALLFGPPGTSKTEVARAIASSLNWPLVEIDPSHFLRNTFQNIYVQAESIFRDVMDMYGVVLLFDELDALVQKRDKSGSPDTESRFLTTYMLPKLAKLHNRGRLIFLMATNYQENFDEAIKRAGRFDRLFCMGPPTLEEKCKRLNSFLGDGKEVGAGGKLLLQFAKEVPFIYDQLTLYTFGEFKSFALKLGTADSIESKLKKMKVVGLRTAVEDDCRTVTMRIRELDFLNDDEFRTQWTPGKWSRLTHLYKADFSKLKLPDSDNPSPVMKYILERQKSKIQ